MSIEAQFWYELYEMRPNRTSLFSDGSNVRLGSMAIRELLGVDS